MELSPICKKEYPALRALYRSAFPAAERMPLSRSSPCKKRGKRRFWCCAPAAPLPG